LPWINLNNNSENQVSTLELIIEMTKTTRLLQWYDTNHRDLPWRNTSDPYKVWLSEIILQQTRVDQGIGYYMKFIGHFPTVQDLAIADEDSILKLWQGLGYYSRARNLHHAAKTVVEKLYGIFPDNYNDLLKLKGVGEYTAAAISSIVFNEAKPAIDGNVMRVISRWYAIAQAVNSTLGLKQIKLTLENLIDKKQPGKFNQAMMEFGAIYCKPKNPNCEPCIFNDNCMAYQKGLVDKLPSKISKIKIKTRYFTYLFITFYKNNELFTIVKKRTENDIWKGLYEFPLIESPEEIQAADLTHQEQIKQFVNPEQSVIHGVSKTYAHQLTHQKIFATFIKVSANKQIGVFPKDYLILPASTLGEYPVSRLIDKYLNDLS